MIEIIPSILVKTEEELSEKIITIEPFVERVHIDIADGIFVPNMTIAGPEEIEMIDTKLKFSAHLMVSKPENHIVRWLETPADRFVFHIEATQKPQEVIDAVKEADKMIGVALNPETSHEKIASIIDQIDFVHFMTVEPGFYGSDFIESVIGKIADFHYLYPDVVISADGGINPENAKKLVDAGVSKLVVGSYIWGSKNIEGAIKKIADSTEF
jgi:ribulose-phosphate 3-epimerase